MNIAGKSTFADGILTLAAQKGQTGALVGQVAWKDRRQLHLPPRRRPANDPGLKFAR